MAKTLARLGISVKTAGGQQVCQLAILSPGLILIYMYHVKFTPEHIAPCLVAEKLRFCFKINVFFQKLVIVGYQTRLLQSKSHTNPGYSIQTSQLNQVTLSKTRNQTRSLNPNLVTKLSNLDWFRAQNQVTWFGYKILIE